MVCVCVCTVQVGGGNVERMKEVEALASRLGATYLGQQPQERDDGEGEMKGDKPLPAEQSPALSGMYVYTSGVGTTGAPGAGTPLYFLGLARI